MKTAGTNKTTKHIQNQTYLTENIILTNTSEPFVNLIKQSIKKIHKTTVIKSKSPILFYPLKILIVLAFKSDNK